MNIFLFYKFFIELDGYLLKFPIHWIILIGYNYDYD
jgi:hypothetical protein